MTKGRSRARPADESGDGVTRDAVGMTVRAARLSGAERREAIVEAARLAFAELGFTAPTRELARRMGVTQALIYKHFASKTALVEAVMERAMAGRRSRCAATILSEDGVPLRERLAAFYRGYRTEDGGVSQRLFVRAGLDGVPIPAQRGAALTAEVFEPVIAALRRETGQPSLDQAPMTRGERELAMMLHASVMFLGIREHVYRMPMPEDRDTIIRLYVDIFLDGAKAVLPAIDRDDTLSVTQLTPRRS